MFSTKLLDVRKEVIELPNEVPDAPLVSVCVPTYQHAEYIRSCLDSILMQECVFPFEVILGEDESTDGTREICVEYAKNYPDRIRLFLHSRENNIAIDGHPTGRFNLLYSLSQARGKYIALCEGDDYWTDPLKLQKQVDFLEANEDFAICHHNLLVVTEGTTVGNRVSNPDDQKGTSGIEDLARGNFIYTASCMFRNGLIKELPYWFIESPVADYVLHLINAQFGKIKFMPDVMGVYRIHQGGLWESRSAVYRNEQWVKLLDLLISRFRPPVKRSLVEGQNSNCQFLIGELRDDGEKREDYSGKVKENVLYLNRLRPGSVRASNDAKVSIVIPLFNNADLTRRCIESIFKNTPPHLFEILLIDNASTDNTDEVIRYFESRHDNVVSLRNLRNRGFAGATNQGIKLSDAPYVLFLNNDTEVTPGWLEAMLAEMDLDDNIGIVGSCLLYPGTRVIQHAGVRIGQYQGTIKPYHLDRLKVIDFVHSAGKSADYQVVTGACMLVRRGVIENLGPLDEGFRNGYEDVDFCLRASYWGYRVRYCAGSVVYHRESMSKGRHDNESGNFVRLNRKWAGKAKVEISEEQTQKELAEIELREFLVNHRDSSQHWDLLSGLSPSEEEFDAFRRVLIPGSAVPQGEKPAKQIDSVPSSPVENIGSDRPGPDSGTAAQVWSFITHAEELTTAKRYTEAAGILQNALSIAPLNVDVLNDLAVVKFLEGKHEEALKSLRQVITLDPANKIANENVRLILQKLGRVLEDVKSTDRESATSDDGKSLERAESLIQERQYMDAEMTLRKILAESPSNLEAMNDLAIVHFVKGEPEEAIALLNKVVTRDPSNIIALKNLGRLCISLNLPEDALQHCLKALEAAPSDAETVMMTAEICRVLGRNEEAYSFYRKVLDLDPGNEAAKAGLQTVNEQAPRGDPATELYNRAQAMITERDYDRAMTTLLEVVAINPNHADAYNDLAVLYQQRGDLERAVSHLEHAVELEPEDMVAAKNLAILYSGARRFEKALMMSQRLLTKNPRDIQANLAVADICVKLNRPADAKLILEGALSLTGNEQLRNQILSAISGIDNQVRAQLAAARHKDSNSDAHAAEVAAPTLPTSDKMVSIVIPVFNKVEFTRQCLQSITDRVRYPNYEVIVVDNASIDETREFMTDLVSTQGKIRYIRNETNLGFVDACNVGAESATGDYILLLNNDTVVNDNWLEALVDFAEKTPDCGAVGSKLIYPNGRLQEAGGITFSDANGWNYGRGASPDSPKFNFVREVDYISGASLMVRKDLWKRVGGLDRRYAPAYYEDADLCFAVRSLGYKVYFEPRSSLVHFEGATSGTNLQEGFKRYQVINRPKFMEKWKKDLVYQYRNDPANVEKASSRGVKGRILVVDPILPMYDRASGSLRTFQLLKMLKSMGFHITYIATNMGLSNVYKPMLEQMGIETYAGDRDGMAFLGEESQSGRINYESLLRERRFDYALIDFWYEAEYYLPIIRKLSPSTRIIIDTVDVHWLREFREAQLQNDQKAVQRAAERKQREISIYKQADRLWVVTPTDEMEVRKYVPGVPTDVIPNVHDKVDSKTEFDSTSDILFVGNFNHLPNRDAVHYFVKEIWPVIREELPNIKFYIVGNNPSDDVRALAADNVIVTGYVKDLTPYWQSARVSVVPLRYGAGMKGKLGDALSYGVPTVSTSVGSEGMPLIEGEDIMVADDPAAFAESVVRLYRDGETWETLSARGKAKIEKLYSPSVVRSRLADVFRLPAEKKNDAAAQLASIVILTYNQLKYTKITIESIRRHTKTPYEIIVVDNASTDGTVEYLKGQKDIRTILNEENVGFPAGCNQGMAIAKGDYIVLLNNDVIVTDDWLKGLIECSGADPKVGIVGPRTNWISGYQLEREITYEKVSQVQAFAAKYRRKNRRKWIEVPRVAGFCMFIKREVLEKIGGLDTLFGIGNCEDDDFCLRSKLSGFKVALAGDVFIHHFGSKSFSQKGVEKYLNVVQSKEKLFQEKWGITPAEWWRDGKELTKMPELKIPLDHREKMFVLADEAESTVPTEQGSS